MDFSRTDAAFLSKDVYDLAIIGGGINGCGIARDAAGRGLKVYLCDQGDLAGATSSASSKLLHGGLRYLEDYRFRLVGEALEERRILRSLAPHIASPLPFLLLHRYRSKWKIRAGLLLYDLLRKKSAAFPRSREVAIKDHAAAEVLKTGLRSGFEYTDCWVDDARLVVLNAVDAANNGAVIKPRTRCVNAQRLENIWRLTVKTSQQDTETIVYAKGLINAGGPWVSQILADVLHRPAPRPIRLLKGSHIVLPRTPLDSNNLAYTLENDDLRVVFSLPFQKEWRLIGTTEIPYRDDPGHATVSAEEIGYLCRCINRYFREPIHPEDVIATYSGVRPLLDDGNQNPSSVTRDYFLDLEPAFPPLLSIYGGN